MEQSFSFAILNSLISTLSLNLTTESLCGGSRQKQYENIFDTLLQLATNHIIGTVWRFLEYWEPQELCILNIDLPFDQKESDVLSMIMDAASVIQCQFSKTCTSSLSVNGEFSTLKASWQYPRLLQSRNQTRLFGIHSTLLRPSH